jgi:hypothetical protein
MIINNGLHFSLANQFLDATVTYRIRNIHVDEYGIIFVPNGYHSSQLGISISIDDGQNFIHRGLSNRINTPFSLHVESVRPLTIKFSISVLKVV